MMFDFEPIKSQTLTQTVSTLAHMVRFIIADVTEASSVPQELATQDGLSFQMPEN